MKKILFFFAIFVSTIQISSAQVYDIYIPSEIVLTDNQWHIDGYSIVEANNNWYLVINPNGYNYYTLEPLDIPAFRYRSGDVVLSYKPYFYSNTLGWLVEGLRGSYFVTSFGRYIVLSSYPVYYDYYYAFNLARHLNMRNYYWHRPHYAPRPIPHHRPAYGPAHRRPSPNPPGRPGSPVIKPRPNQPPRGNGMYNRPPQNRPPQSPNMQRPPQNRPSQSPNMQRPRQDRPSQSPGMQNRPPQNRGSQGRPPQGNGSQNRPPQRSGNHSSSHNGGSHRR